MGFPLALLRTMSKIKDQFIENRDQKLMRKQIYYKLITNLLKKVF